MDKDIAAFITECEEQHIPVTASTGIREGNAIVLTNLLQRVKRLERDILWKKDI